MFSLFPLSGFLYSYIHVYCNIWLLYNLLSEFLVYVFNEKNVFISRLSILFKTLKACINQSLKKPFTTRNHVQIYLIFSYEKYVSRKITFINKQKLIMLNGWMGTRWRSVESTRLPSSRAKISLDRTYEESGQLSVTISRSECGWLRKGTSLLHCVAAH